MSEVFEGYERQYCELSDNLTRSCTSASVLHGDITVYQKVAEKTESDLGMIGFYNALLILFVLMSRKKEMGEIQMHPSSKCSGFCSTGKMLFEGTLALEQLYL
ncbi:hypothetical protein Godav_026382 [Gossypium davidsonii]|uniref:Vesicle transport v-SNARE N-terminal domain-containing protein n=1 Tax=Gossypium davidsonii TaxID=34287 RepID=A0A7J8RTB3_GOSDV|nr:hypothetical protein [Gossypium davidsonii]